MIYKEVVVNDSILTRGLFGWWVHLTGVPPKHFWFFKNAEKYAMGSII